MENIVINPPNYQSEYIKNLNECFSGWGQEKEYDWAFNRQVGDKAADIMLINNEEDEVIAGSGVTYRKVTDQKGNKIDMGIMTASWTLPKARGKGCFSKIIALSQEIVHKKDVPCLTAFVTESNASYRRLASAGSMLVPTRHLFSPEQPYADVGDAEVEVLQDDEKLINDIYTKFKALQQDTVSFSYTQAEFYQQYIDRPKKAEILRIGGQYALIEESYNAIKVLLSTYEKETGSFERFTKLLTNWALKNRSKKLFLFSTQKDIMETCEHLGFESHKGYFTVLDSAAGAAAEGDSPLMQISIHMGDKM